jgi:RNA polymerase sigma-70 factor (sigma-E family)
VEVPFWRSGSTRSPQPNRSGAAPIRRSAAGSSRPSAYDFRDLREPTAAFVCVRGVDDDRGDVRTLYRGAYMRLVGVLAVAAGDRGEAEEVVQEAFIRLIPRWSKVSSYDDPEAWVRKVAFRLLANRQRRARMARRLLWSERREPQPADAGDAVDVSRALAMLPFSQRQVVVLHHLLDLSVEQIAAEVGVPVGTVKSRLARARAALTPLLGVEVADV